MAVDLSFRVSKFSQYPTAVRSTLFLVSVLDCDSDFQEIFSGIIRFTFVKDDFNFRLQFRLLQILSSLYVV